METRGQHVQYRLEVTIVVGCLGRAMFAMLSVVKHKGRGVDRRGWAGFRVGVVQLVQTRIGSHHTFDVVCAWSFPWEWLQRGEGWTVVMMGEVVHQLAT